MKILSAAPVSEKICRSGKKLALLRMRGSSRAAYNHNMNSNHSPSRRSCTCAVAAISTFVTIYFFYPTPATVIMIVFILNRERSERKICPKISKNWAQNYVWNPSDQSLCKVHGAVWKLQKSEGGGTCPSAPSVATPLPPIKIYIFCCNFETVCVKWTKLGENHPLYSDTEWDIKRRPIFNFEI
jgi:hypothetical protein